MSADASTTTVGIDSKNDFIAQVKETGVVVDGQLLRTEGEGRQTRYFVGDEQVRKGDIEDVFADYDVAEVEVPEGGHEHGDIQCRYCGAVLGYLTGSHMKSHEAGPQSVAEYREFVAGEEGVGPSEVPLAPEELAGVFEESGDLDEETRQELSEMNKARWEDGEYDHLRRGDADEASA